MTDVLVVAPHPDDESLGAGGTLLHHKKKGDNVHWLIMTTTVGDDRFNISFTSERTKEIERVSKALAMLIGEAELALIVLITGAPLFSSSFK